MSTRIICPECDVDFTWDRCPSCGYVPPNPDVVHEDEAADEITRLRARVEELEEALEEIAQGDWEALIKRAKAWDCLPDRHWADDPREYEWVGDHETDARHVYPMRQALVSAIARRALRGETDDE